jgi:hypothetical protein
VSIPSHKKVETVDLCAINYDMEITIQQLTDILRSLRKREKVASPCERPRLLLLIEQYEAMAYEYDV